VWADLWFPLIFIFPRRSFETQHDRSKPYIFVINHSSLLDAALLPKAFHQPVGHWEKLRRARYLCLDLFTGRRSLQLTGAMLLIVHRVYGS
jgi:1-acyl-sn-glycerol-3-phosphate acyltransferase